MATVLAVPARDGSSARVVRRDRGRADVTIARGGTLSSYPSPGTTSSVAALQHLGRSPRLHVAFCLRDAIGKRVKQEWNTFNDAEVGYAPCGAAAALRNWLRVRGAAIVEGEDAAVLITRRYLPPFDPFVEPNRYAWWTRARMEITADTATSWEDRETVQREDSGAQTDRSAGPRLLPATDRNAVVATVASVALLDAVGPVYNDSTDSTIAVIRGKIAPLLVADDATRPGVLAVADDGGAIVYGDWTEGRFIPRWEGWSYSSVATPEFIDLDGDGLAEFVFTSYSHDAKGHVVSQEFWAFDRFGRELTRQRSAVRANEEGFPVSAEMVDGEYCDGDCGGLTVGRPGPDGTRPLLTSEGTWVLRDGRYTLRPTPPKPAPKPKATRKAPPKRGAAKSAPKKPAP
jgi:hypothetical protein